MRLGVGQSGHFVGKLVLDSYIDGKERRKLSN